MRWQFQETVVPFEAHASSAWSRQNLWRGSHRNRGFLRAILSAAVSFCFIFAKKEQTPMLVDRDTMIEPATPGTFSEDVKDTARRRSCGGTCCDKVNDSLDPWADDVLPRLQDHRAPAEKMDGDAPPPNALEVKTKLRAKSGTASSEAKGKAEVKLSPKWRAAAKSKRYVPISESTETSSPSATWQAQDRVFSRVQLRVVLQCEKQLNEANSFTDCASEATRMGGNLAGKLLQRSIATRFKTSARVAPLCTKQIANHMLCLELLAKSMASRGTLAIEWSPSYLSRCVPDARANGIPVPWTNRVQANLRQVRVCTSGRNVNGDDKVEVPNGLVQWPMLRASCQGCKPKRS